MRCTVGHTYYLCSQAVTSKHGSSSVVQSEYRQTRSTRRVQNNTLIGHRHRCSRPVNVYRPLSPIHTTRKYGPYIRFVFTADIYVRIFDTRTYGPYVRPYIGVVRTGHPYIRMHMYGCTFRHWYIRALCRGVKNAPVHTGRYTGRM